MYIHFVLIMIALIAIIMWFRAKDEKPQADAEKVSFYAGLLAVWVVAGALLDTPFFVFRPADLFDLSIERMIFIFIVLSLLTGLFTGKVNLLSNIGIELTMLFFVVICIVSMVRTGFLPVSPEFVSPWFVFITGYLFPFIVFVFAKNYLIREKDVEVVLHALFYFGIYLSVIAFFEFADLRQFVFPAYINDPLLSTLHLDRARGPFLNAAFNGVGILIGLICGLHLLPQKTGLAKAFYQTSLLLFLPAVFFTLTRSVYLGLIITLIIFLRWYKTTFPKWKLISLPLAVFLIIGLANAHRLASADRRAGGVAQVEEVNIRLALLMQSYYLFSEQPLMGVGLAQFIPAAYSPHTYKGPVPTIIEEARGTFQHNHLLGVATELGLPGLLVYLLMITLILRRLMQLAGKMPETGLMGNNLRVTIFAIWCVYLNNNLFVEPSNNIFVNAVPFLFAGLADGLYTRQRNLGLLSPTPKEFSPSPLRVSQSHV